VGKKSSTPHIQEKETWTTSKKYFQRKLGRVHPLFSHSEFQALAEMDEIFVMYLVD